MTGFPCYLRFLSPRIVKTANTKTANSEGRLYTLRQNIFVFLRYLSHSFNKRLNLDSLIVISYLVLFRMLYLTYSNCLSVAIPLFLFIVSFSFTFSFSLSFHLAFPITFSFFTPCFFLPFFTLLSLTFFLSFSHYLSSYFLICFSKYLIRLLIHDLYTFLFSKSLKLVITFVSIHSLNIGPLVKQDCSQRYGLYAPTSSLVTTDIYINNETLNFCITIPQISTIIIFFLLPNTWLVNNHLKHLGRTRLGDLIRPVWLLHHFHLVYWWWRGSNSQPSDREPTRPQLSL